MTNVGHFKYFKTAKRLRNLVEKILPNLAKIWQRFYISIFVLVPFFCGLDDRVEGTAIVTDDTPDPSEATARHPSAARRASQELPAVRMRGFIIYKGYVVDTWC